MLLKATEQSDTGLNTKFVNVESGRTVTLKHAIKQIENGNKNYSDYQTVRNSNGTVYIFVQRLMVKETIILNNGGIVDDYKKE